MAYIKQEFQAGEILTAEALNAMDEQVYQNSQVNELTEEKITNILGYTPANKDTVDTQATEIDNLETSVKENATDISTLKTSVERNATDIDELNTKITKRAIINCSAVSSLRNDIGLQIGGHYAEITPDYSGINGNILSTSLIMLGTDQTQDGVLTSHTVLASMVGKSGKIDKIGVITTGVFTVRAKISVTYQ